MRRKGKERLSISGVWIFDGFPLLMENVVKDETNFEESWWKLKPSTVKRKRKVAETGVTETKRVSVSNKSKKVDASAWFLLHADKNRN